MSLLLRDDFFKSSLDDPFFESWDSDLKDFRRGFFRNALTPAVANLTLDEGAAPRALRRQKSWYDRELEAANREGDFSVSKSFAKSDAGADPPLRWRRHLRPHPSRLLPWLPAPAQRAARAAVARAAA